MIDDITLLLKKKFKGSKVEAQKFLESHGFACWQVLLDASYEEKQSLLEVLKDAREHVTIETTSHVISRPADICSVSEISFSIKGHKVK